MLDVVCVSVILFEKSDLINASRRVYSYEIKQNTRSRQAKNRETTSENLNLAACLIKKKHSRMLKVFFLMRRKMRIELCQTSLKNEDFLFNYNTLF